eukprot:COSAG01_NODE_12965_length_1656_cov_1.565832_2_plen_84_part_00
MLVADVGPGGCVRSGAVAAAASARGGVGQRSKWTLASVYLVRLGGSQVLLGRPLLVNAAYRYINADSFCLLVHYIHTYYERAT